MAFSSLYPTVQAQLAHVQRLMDSIDHTSSGEEISAASQELNALGGHVRALSRAAISDSSDLRTTWARRAEAVRAEYDALRSTLERQLNYVHGRSVEAQEREALFAGRAESAVVIDMLEEESASLRRSANVMDSSIAQSTEALSMLRDQNKRLKRARDVFADVAASVGLSDSVIRLIRRRTAADRYLLWVGMAAVLALLYFVNSLRAG